MTPFEVVGELNDDIYDKMGDQFYYDSPIYWEYRSTGIIDAIIFEENVIWCSENDERRYIEDTDTYEDLKQFCIKQVSKKAKLILTIYP